ncbi:MAG: hypothetical protein AB7U73_00885 [Pirellulales bacterium]
MLVTMAAIVFAPLGVIARRKQRERRAIQTLTELGGVVVATPSYVGRNLGTGGDEYWAVLFAQIIGDRPPPTIELTDDEMSIVTSALTDLDRLTALKIESSQVSDDGLLELLRLRRLDLLDLRCPLVTSESTDALQKKFPKLIILDD